METPAPPIDLRRRTLIINMGNITSPLRRSLNSSIMNKSVVESNDEDERADRRSQLQIQKRLSLVSTPKPTNMTDSFIKEQYLVYTHLFTENRINAKNAWKLQIIDMLQPLCKKTSQDVLQVASTSIDISAKVYGLRVDDVHTDGLKLANNMARAAESVVLPDDNEDHSEGEGTASKKKKKKKKVSYTGAKSTINKNARGNLGNLPKLEPTDFTTRVSSDTGTIDNLFTNILKETCTSFILLDKATKFIEESDPSVVDIEKISLKNLPIPENICNINMPFNDFKVNKWDPDEEEKQLKEEKSLISQIQPVVFDDDGFPIPELDGSIHDIFETNDADVEMNDDDEVLEIQEANFMERELRAGIAHVVDFRSRDTTLQSSEYCFNPVLTTSNGKYIDQIWAGPSHWKLKYIRRSTAKFSGQITTAKLDQKKKKRKHEPQMVDFNEQPTEHKIAKLVIKKKPPSIDIHKITLPLLDQSCNRIMATIKELMLRPGVCPVEKKDKTLNKSEEDYEVSSYKYENPNDSLYCSQSQHNADDDNEDVYDNLGEEENMRNSGNLAEYLVENPEMVPNTYIQYASKAKQIDMRKLKSAIWHQLTTEEGKQQNEDKVIPQNFTDMYKALPGMLPVKEKDKLSSSLAFFALLHLANEQILVLRSLPGYKDCFISK